MSNRAIITIPLLVLLFVAYGCQVQPVKMYSGPKLDKIELALIRGEPEPWGEDYETKIWLVDGNYTDKNIWGEEIKSSVIYPPGVHEVLVLPGKHQVCISHGCSRHYEVNRFELRLKTSFELSVEAGKTYQVKVRQIPIKELSDKQIDRLPFRVPHQLWVEDLETGDKVPVQRLGPKETVSIPLTESSSDLYDVHIQRFYDTDGPKHHLDEVSILFVQFPAQLLSINGKKIRQFWLSSPEPLRAWGFGEKYPLLKDNILDYECHLLPGRHELTAQMRYSIGGHGLTRSWRTTTKAGPLTKSAVFKKGHVYYIKSHESESHWTFSIIEVGTIHQAASSLVSPWGCADHWDDCWRNAPDSSNIIFDGESGRH